MVRIDVDGTDGGTTIDVVPLGQCRPDPSLLSPDEQARLASFRNQRAADSYLRRRSELRRRLGARLDRQPASLRFATVANGKPVLATEPGEPAPLQFNLSASGELMALAIDGVRPVGVDVECRAVPRSGCGRSTAARTTGRSTLGPGSGWSGPERRSC